ncbi:MAG: hypothetical protein PPP55_04565 [Halorubrum sp.]
MPACCAGRPTKRRSRTTNYAELEQGIADRVPGDLCWGGSSKLIVTPPLVAAVVLLVVGTVADVWSTHLAITSGEFVEGSPVGRALITWLGPIRGMLATKALGMIVIGIPVAVAGGSRRLVATVMCGVVGILSCLAAGRNLLLVTGYWPW